MQVKALRMCVRRDCSHQVHKLISALQKKKVVTFGCKSQPLKKSIYTLTTLQAIVGSIARARTPGAMSPLHDSSLGHALAARSLRTITTKEGASSPPAPPPQQTYQLQIRDPRILSCLVRRTHQMCSKKIFPLLRHRHYPRVEML